jgi:hypothetical protein
MSDEAKTEALIRRNHELLAQAEMTREVAREAAATAVEVRLASERVRRRRLKILRAARMGLWPRFLRRLHHQAC